jgi:integrase
MATSGMARTEIINLKIGDIEIDSDGIGTIKIRRQKSEVDYVTFISPEATQSMNHYFDERNRYPEQAILGKNDFCFVRVLKTKPKAIESRKLEEQTFSGIFYSLAKSIGFHDGDGFIKSRSHALRKYFASTLENTGMPKNKIDFMLGHKFNDTDLAYFKQDPTKLKELYKLHLPHLAFEKEIKVHTLNNEDAKKLEKLDNENKELKARLIKIESEKEKDTKLITEFMDLMKKEPQLLESLKRTIVKK